MKRNHWKTSLDWREPWIDRMGLIVALGGEERFTHLRAFKKDMRVKLTVDERQALKAAIQARFTPTNGEDGCASGVSAVKEAME
jgi:hypothetical protein